MKSKIDILKALMKSEDVNLTDNHDVEEFYNQALLDGYNIQFVHDGEDSFIAMLVDILNLHSAGQYTIRDLYNIVAEEDLPVVNIENMKHWDDDTRELYVYATLFARRFNLTFHIHNLEGEVMVINGDSEATEINPIVNFAQIGEGFAHLFNNQQITIIENIPIIDILDDIDLGEDDNDTIPPLVISPFVQSMLEDYAYQLFRNPEPHRLEAEIYRNIMQGFAPPAAAPQINVQTDAVQWHPEWQIIPYDPNMYNLDHILAAHNPQNYPPIYAGFQETIFPSFNGIFANMNTDEILAFFVLVGIAFYIGNGYNGAGNCG